MIRIGDIKYKIGDKVYWLKKRKSINEVTILNINKCLNEPNYTVLTYYNSIEDINENELYSTKTDAEIELVQLQINCIQTLIMKKQNELKELEEELEKCSSDLIKLKKKNKIE